MALPGNVGTLLVVGAVIAIGAIFVKKFKIDVDTDIGYKENNFDIDFEFAIKREQEKKKYRKKHKERMKQKIRQDTEFKDARDTSYDMEGPYGYDQLIMPEL